MSLDTDTYPKADDARRNRIPDEEAVGMVDRYEKIEQLLVCLREWFEVVVLGRFLYLVFAFLP